MFLEIISTAVQSLSPPAIIESVVSEDLQIIQRKGLDTFEGRIVFLENDLAPFIRNIDRLNIETQSLSQKIAFLNVNDLEEQSKIVQLSTELTEKMNAISSFLPILENILFLESDFSQLESILEKRSPLNSFEEEVVNRLASLCKGLNF